MNQISENSQYLFQIIMVWVSHLKASVSQLVYYNNKENLNDPITIDVVNVNVQKAEFLLTMTSNVHT